MKVPALAYGEYASVRQGVRRALGQLARGDHWLPTIESAGLLESDSITGLFVLDGPSHLLGSGTHLHIYLPWSAVFEGIQKKRLPAEIEESVFRESLQTAWGVLGLAAPKNLMWLFPPDRHAPFLEALQTFWAQLESAGPRYSLGSTTGSALWELHSSIKYVLANNGVSEQQLAAPLPAGGLAALLKKAKP